MSILSEVKATYAARQMRPLRRRGQNFLINPLIYQQIIEAAELTPDDVVLEIGPGLGHLTELLAQKVKKVFAVEIDKELVEILKNKFITQKNLVIISDDALKIDLKKLKIESPCFGDETRRSTSAFAKATADYPPCIYSRAKTDISRRRAKKYKVVANLPYNITGAILRKFLSEKTQPETMTLMLQKEVARRIIAQPPEMSLPATMVQFYGQPKIITNVSRHNFWPAPKVDSAVIHITKIHHPKNIDEDKFFNLLRAGFSAPRKYLMNNLVRNKIWTHDQAIKIFNQLSLNIQIRAENLNLNQWKNLYRFYGKQY